MVFCFSTNILSQWDISVDFFFSTHILSRRDIACYRIFLYRYLVPRGHTLVSWRSFVKRYIVPRGRVWWSLFSTDILSQRDITCCAPFFQKGINRWNDFYASFLTDPRLIPNVREWAMKSEQESLNYLIRYHEKPIILIIVFAGYRLWPK